MRTCEVCRNPSNAFLCDDPACRAAHNARCREYQRRKRAEYAARGESYRGRWGWTGNYGNQMRRRKLIDRGDSIERNKLGDRNGWICGLCAEPVDPTLRYPAPMSASIDHVLPLAHGGTHTWDNVQITHNRCNVSKKDRLEWAPEVAA